MYMQKAVSQAEWTVIVFNFRAKCDAPVRVRTIEISSRQQADR